MAMVRRVAAACSLPRSAHDRYHPLLQFQGFAMEQKAAGHHDSSAAVAARRNLEFLRNFLAAHRVHVRAYRRDSAYHSALAPSSGCPGNFSLTMATPLETRRIVI